MILSLLEAMIWEFIIYIAFIMAAGHGLFLSTAIYLKNRNQKKEVIYLSAYLASFSIIILYWCIFWINREVGKPLPFVNFGEPFVFLLAPTLYYFLTGKDKGFWWHALAALIPLTFIVPQYLTYYFSYNIFYSDLLPSQGYIVWTSLNIVQIMIYSLFIHVYEINNGYSSILKAGLFAYAIGITLYLILSQFSIIQLYPIIDYLICGAIIVMVYVTSYKTFFVRSLFTSKSQEPDEDSHRLMKYLQETMINEKYYLKPDFRLDDLAQLAQKPKHVLSRILNEQFNISFNDFINHYRISHSEELLLTTNDKLYTIALESGFTNKVSFINNFKKKHGITPTSFRKKKIPQVSSGGENYKPSDFSISS